MVDSKSYLDWFKAAQKDLRSADILFEHDADNEIVCFHCQQAIEKYLKGYLIYKTGYINEGHSLIRLCKRAMEYEINFNKYLKNLAFVNNFYIETRYPAEDPLHVSNEDVADCINYANEIISYIKEITKID